MLFNLHFSVGNVMLVYFHDMISPSHCVSGYQRVDNARCVTARCKEQVLMCLPCKLQKCAC
jgi:hypothetical protein